MEIVGVDKIQTVKKVGLKEGVQATRIEDSVGISSESKKRADWVEMLKQMPDIRLEKIDAALATDAHSTAILSHVAAQISRSGF